MGARDAGGGTGGAGGAELAAVAALRTAGLLPPTTAPAGTELPPAPGGPARVDRAVGSLLGGAVGDALGRPKEGGRPPSYSPSEEGWLDGFVPARRWGGATGVITDDTQLTIEVAETLVARGRLDAEDLSRRLVTWLPFGRGKGQATTQAVLRLEAGTPWHEAGTPSAGNGAAMRVAPVGLLRHDDVALLRTEAALSALPTHRDPMAVSSAILMAYATAWAYTLPAVPASRERAAEELAAALVAVTADLTDPGAPDRQAGGSLEPVRLEERVAEWLADASRTPREVLGARYSGAFVLESLPAAVWCFVHAIDDPERTIAVAANATRDSDTVASMAGNLAGALHGAEALPARWRSDVEEHDRLVALATALVAPSPSDGG